MRQLSDSPSFAKGYNSRVLQQQDIRRGRCQHGQDRGSIPNGTRVDALGWDPSKKLIYIPNGGEGNVTVVHQDSPDQYTVVATVPTFAGAKTIAVDPVTHNAYLFQPERGPSPAPPPGAPLPAAGPGGRGRGPQGTALAAWFIVIKS